MTIPPVTRHPSLETRVADLEERLNSVLKTLECVLGDLTKLEVKVFDQAVFAPGSPGYGEGNSDAPLQPGETTFRPKHATSRAALSPVDPEKP